MNTKTNLKILLAKQKIILYLPPLSGCSVARSSRLVWDQEVAGSNPATPTFELIFWVQ